VWKALRCLLPNAKSQGIQALDINGSVVTDFSTISNHFNSFFINIGEQLAQAIPAHSRTAAEYLQAHMPRVSTDFTFKLVTVEEVSKLLQNLPVNKATGLDNYQAKLLKLASSGISRSLTFILNMSLTTGQFPSDWKRAKISALHKKGSKLDTGNYRPISILPIVSKIMEKIVHQQLYCYLDDQNLLSQAQSGFRKSFSTQTSLHRLTEYIFEALNNSEVVGMVAIDLQKAFDTVNHSILLQKLDHYGVRHVPLKWFTSYLSNRSQVTYVNNVISDMGFIRTGVPQGSILGPLLFILYINDLPGCLRKCEANMYADDTAFYFRNKDKNIVSDSLNEDIINIYSWLCSNKLSLHVGKTNVILVCNHQKVRYLDSTNLGIKLNDFELTQTDSVGYLGVELDSRCNFDKHTNALICKVNKSIGVLKRCSPYLPIEARKTLYNTLVLPHIDYCSTVWGCTSQTNVMRVQRLQNRAMRSILKEGPRTHIEDMLHQLGWLSVKQRLVHNKLVLMWRIVHGAAPSYLTENLRLSRDVHRYNTVGSSNRNIYIPNAHKHSIFRYNANLWNGLPSEMRNIPVLDTFKRHLKAYVHRHIPKF